MKTLVLGLILGLILGNVVSTVAQTGSAWSRSPYLEKVSYIVGIGDGIKLVYNERTRGTDILRLVPYIVRCDLTNNDLQRIIRYVDYWESVRGPNWIPYSVAAALAECGGA